MSKDCSMFSHGNLVLDINESGVLSPYLGLLGITVVQMEVPVTPKFICCFRILQNFKMHNKKKNCFSCMQLNGDNEFDYKNWQCPVKLIYLPFTP